MQRDYEKLGLLAQRNLKNVNFFIELQERIKLETHSEEILILQNNDDSNLYFQHLDQACEEFSNPQIFDKKAIEKYFLASKLTFINTQYQLERIRTRYDY